MDIAIIKTNQIDYQIENFPADLSSDYTPIILKLNLYSTHIFPQKPLMCKIGGYSMNYFSLLNLILQHFNTSKYQFFNISSYKIHLFNQ